MRQSLLHLTQLNASFYRHLDMGAMAVVEKIQQHNVQALCPEESTRGNTFRRCRGLGHPECILPPDRGDAHPVTML
nr:hypothetical protein [Aeromonas caviae]